MSGETQTTYPQYSAIGFVGNRADMRAEDGDSRIAETVIPFGRAVSKGSADKGVILGGTKFTGIAAADKTLAAKTHTTPDQYEIGDTIGVYNEGDFFVEANGDVVAGDPVGWDHVTGKLGSSGFLVEGAKWITTTADGEVAVVRLIQETGNLNSADSL